MKRKTLNQIAHILLFTMSIAMAFVFSFSSTVSWFFINTHSTMNVEGNVHGSYFESGDGTEEDPFEIARPIQLYYLSWLQEMGYFNEAQTNESTGDLELKRQYNFYLSKDIDMSVSTGEGSFIYNLPPIGTVEYPFVGSFDGKGHKITNLQITNYRQDYTNDPYNPTHEDDPSKYGAGYEILGMFGVLGTTNSGSESSLVKCSEITDTGTINQLPNDATFNPAKTIVKNFYLENVTITASTDKDHALLGVVAGYANASISGVGIKGTSFLVSGSREPVTDLVGTSSNTLLSKYTTVGLTTENNHREYSVIDEDIYAPKATQVSMANSSTGDDWGGSLEFESILERVRKSRNLSGSTTNSIPSYAKERTIVKDVDGTELDNRVTATSTNPISTDSSNIYYKQDDNIGSYYYKLMTDSGAKKVYIAGYSDVPSSGTTNSALTEHIVQKSNNLVDAYYFSDDSGYIGINAAGTLTHYASTSNAIKWQYNSTTNDLFSLQTINGEYSFLYLNYNLTNGFSIGQSGTTSWVYKNNNFYAPSSEASGTAITFNVSSATGYKSSSSKMNNSQTSTWSASNTTLPSGNYKAEVAFKLTNSSHGSQTMLEENKTTPLYYLTVGGTECWPEDTTSTRSSLGITTNSFTYISYGNVSVGTGTKSIVLSHSGGGYSMYISGVRFTPMAEDTLVSSTQTTDNEIIQNDEIKRGGTAGYIPLSVNGSKTDFTGSGNPTIDKYETAISNTGYIIGGYYDKSNGSETWQEGDTINNQYTGDVRIAAYAINNIQNSYANNSFKNIYTFNENGKEIIDSNEYSSTGNASTRKYKKMASSMKNLEDSLRGSSYVYGVHFMSSAISMNHLITAPKATINGDTFYNYQMPEDSIDFNLKAKGYINFFAGDYQNDNNSFFSLHEIFRDPNDSSIIQEIKEIKYVYGPSDGSTSRDYIYKYTDGTWSTTGLTDNGDGTISKTFGTREVEFSLLFDTLWIGKNGSVPRGSDGGKDLWYFEIPCNKGEYALGSVDGACGGYLVYLDISAGAQTIERKEITELFVKNTSTGDIANGIQYVSSIPDALDNKDDKTINVRDMSVINDKNSYVAELDATANGSYTINRTSNDIQTTSANSALTTSHIGDGLTLNGVPIDTSVQTTIRRITDYDYNTMTGLYVKQVTVVETTAGVNKATTSIAYNSTSFTTDFDPVATFSYSWEGSSPTFAYRYFLGLADVGDNSLEVSFEVADNDNFDITVEQLSSGFTFNVRGNDTTVLASEVTEENHPVLHVTPTLIAYTADVWYDFTKENGGYTNGEATVTPTKINHIHYYVEGDETVTENYSYCDYSNLGTLSNPSNVPAPITITNGEYIYEYLLSGSNGESNFYVWYTEDGITIRSADGSQEIHFVRTSEGTYEIPA